MKSYCVLANGSIEFKRQHFSNFLGNKLFGFRALKIKNCPPSKLFLFTSLVYTPVQ